MASDYKLHPTQTENNPANTYLATSTQDNLKSGCDKCESSGHKPSGCESPYTNTRRVLSQVYKEHVLRANKVGLFASDDAVKPQHNSKSTSASVCQSICNFRCHSTSQVTKSITNTNHAKEDSFLNPIRVEDNTILDKQQLSLEKFYVEAQKAVEQVNKQDDMFLKWFSQLHNVQSTTMKTLKTSSTDSLSFGKSYSLSGICYNDCVSQGLSHSSGFLVNCVLIFNTFCGGKQLRTFIAKMSLNEEEDIEVTFRPTFTWSDSAADKVKKYFLSGSPVLLALEYIWNCMMDIESNSSEDHEKVTEVKHKPVEKTNVVTESTDPKHANETSRTGMGNYKPTKHTETVAHGSKVKNAIGIKNANPITSIDTKNAESKMAACNKNEAVMEDTQTKKTYQTGKVFEKNVRKDNSFSNKSNFTYNGMLENINSTEVGIPFKNAPNTTNRQYRKRYPKKKKQAT